MTFSPSGAREAWFLAPPQYGAFICFWIFAQMFSESELCTNYSTAPDPRPSFPLISSLLPGHQLPVSSHHKAARGVLLNYPSAPLPCSEPALGSPVPSGGSPSSFLDFQDLSLSGSCCPFPSRPSTLATFQLPSLCPCCSSCLACFSPAPWSPSTHP